jgi:hypothetical protein
MTVPDRSNAAVERVIGFIVIASWIAFLATPFAGLQGTRNGIFITSPDWDAQARWAIIQGAIVGLAALFGVLLITALGLSAISRQNLFSHRTAARVSGIAFLALLFVLPFWGWGFERSFLRVWAHERSLTLGIATIDAEVNSYYVSPGRRGREIPRLNLRVPPYGRLQIQHHPEFRDGFTPQKGMTLQLAGRRTWVGTYYDKVQWPADWLPAPSN